MPALRPVVSYMDKYLRHAGFPDYSSAWNGLQLENSGRISKIGAAVDACEPVMKEAVKRGITLLIVHHGLMWEQHSFAFTGARYRKLKLALDGDLAVYSSHLPLDAHSVVGNAVQLAKALGLRKIEPFFPYKGEPVGVRGALATTLDELVERVKDATIAEHITLCRAGPARVKKIGIVTGGAGSEVAEIARSGVDTFITGEGPHWSFTAAEELGLNVIYAGHYATETFGVRALAEHVAKKFKIDWVFIDHPTGL
jgi:dinuclear metal center YbgI/SA1388 family protein